MSTASFYMSERDRIEVRAHADDGRGRTGPYLSLASDGLSVALFINVEQIAQIEAGLAALRMELAATEARKAEGVPA